MVDKLKLKLAERVGNGWKDASLSDIQTTVLDWLEKNDGRMAGIYSDEKLFMVVSNDQKRLEIMRRKRPNVIYANTQQVRTLFNFCPGQTNIIRAVFPEAEVEEIRAAP